MASEMREYTVGELVVNFDRKRKPLSSGQRAKMKGSYPYYGATGVFDYVNNYLFDGEYILLAEDGTVLTETGKPVLQRIHGKTWVNNHAHILRNTGLVDFDYLYYLLENTPFSGAVTGAVQLKISQANMNTVRVFIHTDKNDQRKIAEILRALDSKIELNNKINDNLQQQAAAIYKSWFVDFSLAGKAEMVDSEIGKIPCGWRLYRLSEFLPVITGKKNANVSSDKGAYPFFSCSQDFSWTDDYSFEGHAILVAGNGDFNVKWYRGKFEAYQRTYVLIPYEERYTSWLYYAVKYNLTKITSAARGSVIKFITKGNLEDFAFVAPSDLCSCEIIDTFAAINRKIDCLTQENYRLAAIRDTLLPRLMSGEIDVSDINI